MSQINVSHLTFAYEGSYDHIFEDVSFQLDTDWKLGLIGRNGRGKTTLLRLLLGEYIPQGTIVKPVGMDYFPFPVQDTALPAADVIRSICPECAPWELSRELARLEVDEAVLSRAFGTLSNGEQTKLLLAALFLQENRFLLIDEPTNHLDAEARVLVAKYLRSKKGFILVSHDRMFLDGCVDHILSINKTNIEVQKGNFSSWLANKQRQDAFEQSEHEKLLQTIGRLGQAAKRTAGWSDKVEKSKYGGTVPDRGFVGHKSAKMMKRAKAIEARRQTAVEEKQALLQNVERVDSLQLTPAVYHTNCLAEARALSVQYGTEPVCTNVSFTVCAGQRIALCGRNGSGKSSILKLLAGEELPHTGLLRTGSGLIVSCVPQDTSFLSGNLSAYAAACGIDESRFKTILRKLDFSRVQFEKDMHDFSAGQKKKVLIARSLCEHAHLYLWDEPLNFIDIFSRMQIEELLLSSSPTMVFVEHDRAFTDQIATDKVNLTTGV